MHTIKAFREYDKNLKIVVVLPEKDIDYWKELCDRYKFSSGIEVQKGGKTRFESVQNGLELIGDQGLVAIHDGVRPAIDPEIISASYSIATIHGSAIASVRLKESIRIIDKDQTRTVDRSKFRLIQTPQTFQIPIIKQAYSMVENKDFTDDAAVVENAGYKISLFEGSYRNIKITTSEDLAAVEVLLRNRQ